MRTGQLFPQPIPDAGLPAATLDGQLLIYDAGAGTFGPALLTAGANVTITNGPGGAIEISAAGGGGGGGFLPTVIQSAYARGNPAAITIAAPAAGNVLVFIGTTGPNGTFATPAGLTLYYASGATSFQRGQVWYRICDGATDPTTYSFTAGDNINVACYEVHGLRSIQVGGISQVCQSGSPGSPVAVNSVQNLFTLTNSNKTVTTPLLTPGSGAALVMVAFEWDNGTAVSSTSLAIGWTVDHDFTSGASGNHYGIILSVDTTLGLAVFGSQSSFTTAAAITSGLICLPVFLFG